MTQGSWDDGEEWEEREDGEDGELTRKGREEEDRGRKEGGTITIDANVRLS